MGLGAWGLRGLGLLALAGMIAVPQGFALCCPWDLAVVARDFSRARTAAVSGFSRSRLVVAPNFSSAGRIRAVSIPARRFRYLNSALFCQDDNDHAKLCIRRRCLDAALKELRALDAHLNVALVHHPLDWLSDIERSNIKASRREFAAFVSWLRPMMISSSARGLSVSLIRSSRYRTVRPAECRSYGRTV